MEFIFTPLEIPDVLEITHGQAGDSRGFFSETYREDAFMLAGIPTAFVQENQSRSASGTLRGLHYQRDPHAQGKLVRCVRGAIYDVAVDIRVGSPSYGKWVAIELSDRNRKMLYIPPGFAHGFYALTDCDMMYRQTRYYAPEAEAGICWNDPSLSIPWPLTGSPLLSGKDRVYPSLQQASNNFTYI